MKLNKTNLVFFLPNFSEGGAGRSITTICNNLDNKFFNLTVISIGKCYYKKLFNKKTTFYELDKKKTLFSFFQIRKILKKNYNKKNTIFISNMNYANILSCLFIKLGMNFSLVLSERTPLKELYIFYNFSDFFKKKIIYFLMKLIYRFADKVVVNSLFTKNEFDKKIKCNLELIHSPSLGKIKIKKVKNITGKLRILSIGRLSKEKRFDILIDIIEQLKKHDVKAHIIGNGPLEFALKQKIKSKKLSRKIIIKKYNKNYIHYFKKNNIYINTSDFEGFPNTVVEAINNNLFVLSRDSGGGIHDMIINSSFGKIIDSNDPKILANELLKISTKKINKKFHNKNNIITKKFNNFLSYNVSKKYEKIFKSLV